jgi:hypothetical protein
VCFSYLAPKEFEIICLPNLFAMNVPDEGYGRKVLADFGYPVYVLLPKNFRLFSFSIF